MYTVYGASFCSWCTQAKQLLEDKKADFIYVDIQIDETGEWKKIAEENNFKTIPQIFKDGVHIGGYQELAVSLSS